jgi:hypothetical protein
MKDTSAGHPGMGGSTRSTGLSSARPGSGLPNSSVNDVRLNPDA